jgi:hypothetical protein
MFIWAEFMPLWAGGKRFLLYSGCPAYATAILWAAGNCFFMRRPAFCMLRGQ